VLLIGGHLPENKNKYVLTNEARKRLKHWIANRLLQYRDQRCHESFAHHLKTLNKQSNNYKSIRSFRIYDFCE